MIKTKLQNLSTLQKSLSDKKQSNAREFTLRIVAKSLSSIQTVDKLVGMSSYIDKIDIMTHQTNTALHVLNNFSHRALLADEVGLGKTIEAGIIIKEYIARKLVKKILILVPATLKYQWQQEMKSKFSEDFVIADNPDDYKDNLKVISSIDTAKTKKHSDVVQSIHWDLIIIDEAHKLKNSSTQNYKLVKSIKKERCLMLTATPLQNNMFELWALLDLLHPGFLGTKAKFTEDFIDDKAGLRVKNKDALQDKLGKIMVRNLRRDTGLEFSKRKVKSHLLSYNAKEMSFYNEAVGFIRQRYEEIQQMEKLNEEDSENSDISEEELLNMAEKYKRKGLLTFGLIMLTRQITSSIKTGVQALKRYKETIEDEKTQELLERIILQGELIQDDVKVKELLKIIKKEKEKVIIFTTFMHTQKILEDELIMNGFSTVAFNGKMNAVEKESAIEEFRQDKQILICTDAGSEGRNLQFAHILINFDLPWNPMRIEQRIGRVHRIGQKRDVQIHNIAIKDTIEGYILNKLYEKINLFSVAIGEMDEILTQLKSKGNIEQNVFEFALKKGDAFTQDFMKAKEKLEMVKQFDKEIFDSGKK